MHSCRSIKRFLSAVKSGDGQRRWITSRMRVLSSAFVHIAHISWQESGAIPSITHARDFLLPSCERIVINPLRRRQLIIFGLSAKQHHGKKSALANERRSYNTIKNALIPNFAVRIAAERTEENRRTSVSTKLAALLYTFRHLLVH